jgi:hypothetical protein
MLSKDQLYDLNSCEKILQEIGAAFVDTKYTEKLKNDVETCRFLVHRVIVDDE